MGDEGGGRLGWEGRGVGSAGDGWNLREGDRGRGQVLRGMGVGGGRGARGGGCGRARVSGGWGRGGRLGLRGDEGGVGVGG